MRKWKDAEMKQVHPIAVNKVVNTMKEVDFEGMKLPMVAVYEKPLDFPDKYIARVFDCEKPTNVIIIRDSLQACQEDIKVAGFLVCMERSLNDALSVVETWMK